MDEAEPPNTNLDDELYRLALSSETDIDTFQSALASNSATACGARNRWVRLRARALDDDDAKAVHPAFKRARQALLQFPRQTAFDRQTLRVVARMTRRELQAEKMGPTVQFDDPEIAHALKNLPILPPNLAASLPLEEQLRCRQATVKNRSMWP